MTDRWEMELPKQGAPGDPLGQRGRILCNGKVLAHLWDGKIKEVPEWEILPPRMGRSHDPLGQGYSLLYRGEAVAMLGDGAPFIKMIKSGVMETDE